MAERGIAISYESIQLWWIKFGPKYARRLRRRHQGYGDTFYLDEVFVRIQGIQHYLWRAIDQDGEVVYVFLQRRGDGTAAKRFFKRLLRASGNEPRLIALQPSDCSLEAAQACGLFARRVTTKAKRRSDAVLWSSNDARSGPILQVLGE